MKHLRTFIIAILCAVAGTANTAQAETVTVTYTLSVGSNTIQFTKGSDTPINATLEPYGENNILKATGFHVTLANDAYLQVSLTNTTTSQNMQGVTDNGVQFNGTATFTFRCPNKYITHIAIKNQNGTAINRMVNYTATTFDLDVDLDKFGTNGATVTQWSGNSNSPQVKTISITYSDTPRSYSINYTNAVNGQNGVTNTNATSYNVTTDEVRITVPTRTGYTFSGFTYTDAAHSSPTAASLPMGIHRGEAATRKAITFEAAWTPITYTLRLHHNDGTDGYTDMAMTYDVAQNIQSVSRSGYVLEHWSTNANGTGTNYAYHQSVINLSTTQGDVIDLYAQWWLATGSCGPTANWSYDLATHTLSITGTGEVTAWLDDRPWQHLKDDITTLNIADGITRISNSAFMSCRNLATVTGGNGLTYVDPSALADTQWIIKVYSGNVVAYLGHVAYHCGGGVSGEVTIADGTYTITEEAFYGKDITAVTIPASVTSIDSKAFYDCTKLVTVNMLGATPPALSSDAFEGDSFLTFYVRSAAYKTADNWRDINLGNSASIMHVISTLTLPANVSTDATPTPVTIAGTDYYTEGATITITPAHGYILIDVSVNGTPATDNGDGTWRFTMPAADATVTASKTLMGVDILLDDDSAQPAGYKNTDRIAALADGKAHNIMLYGRTLYRDGDWNTLCLPFEIESEEIRVKSDNPLYGATIMFFDHRYWHNAEGERSYSNTDGYHQSGEVENGSLHLYFNNSDRINADEPYIVKWTTTGDPIVNPVFQNVFVTSTSPGELPTKVGPGNVSFRGTYSPVTLTGGNTSVLYLGSNNNLYYPANDRTIGAFRAYFELGNGLTVGDPASPIKEFKMNFGEEDATSLSEELRVKSEESDDAIYNLSGQRLSKPQKGINIVNGRKILK